MSKKITLPDGRKIDRKYEDKTLVWDFDYRDMFYEFGMREPKCVPMFYYVVHNMDKNNRLVIRIKDLSEIFHSSASTIERRIKKLRESGLMHTEISEGKTCFVVDKERCFVVD